MGKSVVWIDDNINVMKEVVSYVFPSLWEKDITSYIRITNKAEKSVEHLNRIIYDQFVSYIIDKGYLSDDKIVVQKEKLVKTSTATTDKMNSVPTADIVKNISNLFDKYHHQISEIYNNIASNVEENTGNDSSINPSEDSEKPILLPEDFIKEITKGFKSEISFGIDLCLLDGDYKILKERQNTPILSMVLYNSLIKQNITTFLYTTYYVPNNIIEGWNCLYSRFFNSECGKIDIYNRRGLNVSRSKNPDELVNLITGVKK